MKPVRTLVVDDSATMRGLIRAALARDPDVAVVGEAADPIEARQAIKRLSPDVMTLDVEMPRMDGLDFLEKVMRLRPFPVVMVSSRTAEGSRAAIAAMERGAVSCVAKPTPEDPDAFADLAAKVKSAAQACPDRRLGASALGRAGASGRYRPDGKIVAIGASTGGVEALIAVVSRLPQNCPPTLIAIHMPSPFTRSFARRLDAMTPASVAEAEDGAPIRPGEIRVAPGGAAHLELAGRGEWRCRLRSGEPVNGHRPSVDVLFHSVANACGANAVGVILTGMGRDGAAGLLAMRRAGARTVGQNEATSIVYGMPRTAFEIGAVEKQSPLQDVARDVLDLTSAYHSEGLGHGPR
jgi:two-component system chemotaxis response regulator CheB